MNDPNVKQKAVIEQLDGVCVVDAGAGTGKTFTITKRYLNILSQEDVNLDDILLVTFTRNAASSLKEKVISVVDSSIKDKVLDAPICSFDAYCSKLVFNHGLNAPKFLGLKGCNLSSYKLITEDVILRKIFSHFFNEFLVLNEEKYADILSVVSSSSSVLKLIEELISKGIYPTSTGWFLDGGNKVLGDWDGFCEKISKFNSPVQMKTKVGDSEILKFFNSAIKNREYLKSDLPLDFDSGNVLSEDVLMTAFKDPFVLKLEDFIHDIYLKYIEFMCRENYMTFSLNAMYAFLILYFDKKVRDENSFEYVMIDEFQDTNEMQFMLILLLLKSDNLCVVGDWKQGIYGFRNASITNITHFKDKFSYFAELLNSDGVSRVNFSKDTLTSRYFDLDFSINYRSSQKILDFSNGALTLPASSTEKVELNSGFDVVKLETGVPSYDEFSEIGFLQSDSREEEIDSILDKISSLVGRSEISDLKHGGSRLIRYSDIAILSRNRTFGLDILKRAEELGCPCVYDGGIYLFLEEPSILLLAWIKLMLNLDCRSSWITILEKENLSFLEIEEVIVSKNYPTKILEYRNHLLKNRKLIAYVVDDIFKKYGFNDSISNSIVLVLDNLFNSTLMSLSDVVIFIEDCIKNNSTFNVEISNSSNCVKIQTIHGSKGLEYPIVFIVNCNVKNFPSNIPNTDRLVYSPVCGVRCKKEFDSDLGYIFDSWKSNLVTFKLFSDLDEERRLMYVAITRAMFSVYFTAFKPSTFFTELAGSSGGDVVVVDSSINAIPMESNLNTDSPMENGDIFQKKKLKNNFKFKFELVYDECFSDDLKIKSSSSKFGGRVISAHALMNNFVVPKVGRGKSFGNEIHRLAFRHILGLPNSNIGKDYVSDYYNIKKYVESLGDCKRFAEEDCMLKLSDDIYVRGIIDSVFVYSEKVVCVDWKSDLDKINLAEYRKQLSVYYWVLKDRFKGLDVEVCVFWTNSGEVSVISPLSVSELLDLV